ncbi:hypothetical protein LCI18_006459 [Fusarium solani-melongenae]|uniref:Uncharacterized protein n=1 Tax=Fusarium solani subsp. cucurbitae TaxID=2747967 RepID=A0ACD3Z2P8_FUSSC|nr:hypothetical protein LCI18_006459 [Fusarium solani-melongenae]
MAFATRQPKGQPSRFPAALLHAVGVASFIYSFYLLTTWKSIFTDAFGWYFQLLTVVGLATSLLAFTFGVLADLTLSDIFFDAKNTTSILATPLEVVISVLYWSIKVYDSSLLMPRALDIDPLLDIGFHLAPAVLLSLDFIVFSPAWKITARGMMPLSVALALVYWCWIELCFQRNGWYPYPLFGQFSAIERSLIFVLAAGLLTASSSTLQWVHGGIQGPVLSSKNKAKVY